MFFNRGPIKQKTKKKKKKARKLTYKEKAADHAEYCKWYARRKIPKWNLAKEKLFSSSEDNSDITSTSESSSEDTSFLKPTGSPYQPTNWAAKLINRPENNKDNHDNEITTRFGEDDTHDTTQDADNSIDKDSKNISDLSPITTPILRRQCTAPTTKDNDSDTDDDNDYEQQQKLKEKLRQRWRSKFTRSATTPAPDEAQTTGTEVNDSCDDSGTEVNNSCDDSDHEQQQKLKEKLRQRWRNKFTRPATTAAPAEVQVIGTEVNASCTEDEVSQQWEIKAPTLSFTDDDNSAHNTITKPSQMNSTQHIHVNDHSSDQWAIAAPLPSFMQQSNYTNTTHDTDTTITTWLPATILVGGDCSMSPWSSPAAPSMILSDTHTLHIYGHHYHHHHNQYTPQIYSNIQAISPIKHTRIEVWGRE